ncbi:MAG: ribonuclease HIII [Parachlamydiaceae bacterium]|nr:ribonuclease HIII [Parachlamydiaceae bacterium]
MNQTSKSPFVTTIDLALSNVLAQELQNQGFEITHPIHTRFSAKKKGIVCTVWESGKLVVQGKESAEFIEFFLEPYVLKTFNYTHPHSLVTYSAHIGVDESGKGDFFGPLCIAGVYVPADQFGQLQSIGVKDSKQLTEKSIKSISKAVKKDFLYHIVKINPQKYNEIYHEFKNLNRLLAWGHATVIENMFEKSNCANVVIDQFADESVVELALKRKKMKIDLTQRHRGEEDPAVAAASILARATFVESMDQLSEKYGVLIPKGCSSAVKVAAKKILLEFGEEELRNICKQHFKTLDAILGKHRE